MMATPSLAPGPPRSMTAAGKTWGKLLLTLTIGFAGSLLAGYAGLPAAALIGSTLTVAGAALLKLTTDIPRRLRDLAFILIGCTLGSGITPEALDQAIHWPISLAILAVTVGAIMLCCSWLLTKFFGQSLETAALATSPGALAYTLALAASGFGDPRTIIVIQSIRLLLITTLLPLILGHLDLRSTQVAGVTVPAMAGGDLVLLVIPSMAVGWGFARLRTPAAYLLAGILVSGGSHYAGWIDGRPPAESLFVGFTITGTVIGARFSTIPRLDLKKLLKASLVVLLLSVAISACFAAPTAALLGVPYGQVFVAFAPGGVEAMAVMAIALGYDPTYVAIHHLFRIFLLMALLPLIFKAKKLRTSNKSGKRS